MGEISFLYRTKVLRNYRLDYSIMQEKGENTHLSISLGVKHKEPIEINRLS